MSDAVIALLGVVAGGILAGGFQVLRDLRIDAQNKRAAVRRIYADLRLALARISQVESRSGLPNHWLSDATWVLPTESWLEHSTLAAGLVDTKTWDVLVSAIMAVSYMNRMFSRKMKEHQLDLTPKEVVEVRRAREYVEYTLERVRSIHEGRRIPADEEPQRVYIEALREHNWAATYERLCDELPGAVNVQAAQPDSTDSLRANDIQVSQPEQAESCRVNGYLPWAEASLRDSSWPRATERVQNAIEALGLDGHARALRRPPEFGD
jgi:hypothetical protein